MDASDHVMFPPVFNPTQILTKPALNRQQSGLVSLDPEPLRRSGIMGTSEWHVGTADEWAATRTRLDLAVAQKDMAEMDLTPIATPERPSRDLWETYHTSTILTPERNNFVLGLNGGRLQLLPFDVTHVELMPPVRQTFGGSLINILYGKDMQLMFQTPPMRLPFGFSKFKNTNRTTEMIELDFYDRFRNNDIEQYMRCLRQLDYFVLKTVTKNRDTWLPNLQRRKVPDEDIWKHFSGTTRQRENKEHDRSFEGRQTVKVKPTSALFAMGSAPDDRPIKADETSLPKDTWVVASVVCTGLWVQKETMSIGWRLDQARIVPEPALSSAADPLPQTRMRLVGF